MLTHGIDVPDTRTIFLCRPTLSDILYAQMVGRGSRIDRASGKTTFNVIDFVDLSDFQERLVTGARFFGSTKVAPRSTALLPRRPIEKLEELQSRLAFDPTGAPTWIADRPDVPDAARCQWYRTGQTFGLEFEFTRDGFNEDLSDALWIAEANKIRAMLASRLEPGRVAERVLTQYMGIGGKDHSVWNIERDNSCGWEVTSRVMANESGFLEVARACDVFRTLVEEHGFRVNYRTGLHLHLGWIGRNLDELKRAILLAKLFEPALASIVAPSRIAHFSGDSYDIRRPNEYCAPLCRVFPQSAVAGATTQHELLSAVSDRESRYVTFNLHPFREIHTVEVRMHNGTFDASKVLTWVSLWMQILWCAAESKEVPDSPDRDVIVPNGDLLALVADYLPAVQQSRFLYRLDQRRREVLSHWQHHQDLAPWVPLAQSWKEVPPPGSALAPAASARFASCLSGEGLADAETGLIWRTKEPDPLPLFTALQYAQSLKDGGSWRLPTREELETFLQAARQNVMPTGGLTPGCSYWAGEYSSMSGELSSVVAWPAEASGTLHRVRCIRPR